MSDKKKTASRTRNYATVVYLESVKENWLDILEQEKVPMFISPYHNKDKNPTGEIKKAHYHIMIMFENVKTKEQAKEIIEKINGVGVETINSVRSYARYLCHLDNPDKEQYDTNDVKCLAGADYYDIIQNINDKYIIISEMMEFIESYNILSFYQLSLYSKKNRQDWFRCLCDNSTYYIKEYLKSRQWSIEKGIAPLINKETGEIIEL